MRFLSLIRINEAAGKRPDQRLIDAITQLTVEMTADGTLLDTGGLCPTAAGKRVRLTHGRQKVSDGPFTESKEVIGGYAMLQADSIDHALQLVRRFLDVHGDDWEVECELRQVYENCPEG